MTVKARNGKNGGGPPLTYTKKIGDEICDTITKSSKGIGKLCAENPHWPCKQVIFEWRHKVKQFGEQYAQAKREQIEAFIDDCIDIADDSDSISYNVARLRIDTRKWIACKLAPKIYGDKVTLEDKTDTTMVELDKVKEIVKECMKPQL